MIEVKARQSENHKNILSYRQNSLGTEKIVNFYTDHHQGILKV